MQPETMDDLKEQVAAMRRRLHKLRELGRDFPAVERNARRVSASLTMIELSLGGSALDAPLPGPLAD